MREASKAVPGQGSGRRFLGGANRGSLSAVPVGFLLPFLVLFVLFFVLPIGYAVWESLFVVEREGIYGTPEKVFAGLANYTAALSDRDFVGSIGRVLLFVAIQVPTVVVLATILALLLDSAAARFKQFFRVAFFLPYGVPGAVAALLWGFLYTPQLSPITEVLGLMGLEVDFLSQDTTLLSIVNVSVWTLGGYNMLILLAQLQSIPPELYEAARMDGAGGWRIAWNVKLPLVQPALVLVTVFSVIGALQLFAEPMVLQSINSNISDTYTPNLSAYNEAFAYNNDSYAAAQAVIIAVMALVLSFGFLSVMRRRIGGGVGG